MRACKHASPQRLRQRALAWCFGPSLPRRTCGVMAQYLPPKVEQVVFCKMSPLQVGVQSGRVLLSNSLCLGA